MKLTATRAAFLLVLAALLMAVFLSRSGATGVTVSFRGYEDHWETNYSGPDLTRPSLLHWPREATFVISNRTHGVISVWSESRLEFRQPARLVDAVPGYLVVLAPGANTDVTVALSGSERGTWRILVPVSDLRLLLHVEKWIGKGAISDWVKQHQKKSPHWIASDWVNELPQRSSMPPAKNERDGSDQPIRIKAPSVGVLH